jgi:hypothetical protein
MQSVLFNRDLLVDCILPRLNLFDVFNVFKTCKGIRETYARKCNIPKEVTTSLSLHLFQQRLFKGLICFYGKQNAHEIMCMLGEGLVFLTGGFLLALINAEDYTACADVDLVTVLSCVYEKPKRTRQMCRERSAQIISMLGQAVKIPGNAWDSVFYEDGFAVDTYSVNAKKLQIIHLREADFYTDATACVSHYCRWFDFQFCANFFAKNKLVCMFPDAVKHRSTKLETRIIPKMRFPNLPDQEELLMLNRAWERITKYRAKGYHVDMSDLLNLDGPAVVTWNAFWEAKLGANV